MLTLGRITTSLSYSFFISLPSAQPGDRQRDMPTSREARQRLSQGPARPNQVEPNSPLVAMLVILRNMAETGQCDMAVCTFAAACVSLSLCGVAPFRVLIALCNSL